MRPSLFNPAFGEPTTWAIVAISTTFLSTCCCWGFPPLILIPLYISIVAHNKKRHLSGAMGAFATISVILNIIVLGISSVVWIFQIIGVIFS